MGKRAPHSRTSAAFLTGTALNPGRAAKSRPAPSADTPAEGSVLHQELQVRTMPSELLEKLLSEGGQPNPKILAHDD